MSLIIGTQTLSQLPEKTIAAVFGNCATLVSFRVSSEDARALTREFGASGEGPRLADQMYDLILPASELQNLPDFKLYIRTLIKGRPEDPFLVKSFPPFEKSGRKDQRARVVQTSGARFGRDRQAVERNLNRFLSPALDALR